MHAPMMDLPKSHPSRPLMKTSKSILSNMTQVKINTANTRKKHITTPRMTLKKKNTYISTWNSRLQGMCVCVCVWLCISSYVAEIHSFQSTTYVLESDVNDVSSTAFPNENKPTK